MKPLYQFVCVQKVDSSYFVSEKRVIIPFIKKHCKHYSYYLYLLLIIDNQKVSFYENNNSIKIGWFNIMSFTYKMIYTSLKLAYINVTFKSLISITWHLLIYSKIIKLNSTSLFGRVYKKSFFYFLDHTHLMNFNIQSLYTKTCIIES